MSGVRDGANQCLFAVVLDGLRIDHAGEVRVTQDLVHFGNNVPVPSVCDPSKLSKPVVLSTQLDARRVQPSDPTIGNKHRFVVQHFVELLWGIDDEAH